MKKRACIPPCSGVEKPKKYTLFWDQEIMKNYVLYCIVLYCIGLDWIGLDWIGLDWIGDKDHIYALLI